MMTFNTRINSTFTQLQKKLKYMGVTNMITPLEIHMSKKTHMEKKHNITLFSKMDGKSIVSSHTGKKNMSVKKKNNNADDSHLDSNDSDTKNIDVKKLEAKAEYLKEHDNTKGKGIITSHNKKSMTTEKNNKNNAECMNTSHFDPNAIDAKKIELKDECSTEHDITDVSGKTTIQTELNASAVKKWIKLIPINKTISYDKYELKNNFALVANIVLDNDKLTNGENNGSKKRNTLIKFRPTITQELFVESSEWLYLFVINGQIVKIGGTRTGLKQRVRSYLCGHHVPERGKSGDCSKTNAYIYNTFEFYLQQGCAIQMYGYALPKIFLTHKIIDEKVVAPVQTYHIYESKYLKHYKQKYGDYPFLSDNCDPVHRR